MAQAASAMRQAPTAMIEMSLSTVVVLFLALVVGDPRGFLDALTSTV
jgi:hypothetical protein